MMKIDCEESHTLFYEYFYVKMSGSELGWCLFLYALTLIMKISIEAWSYMRETYEDSESESFVDNLEIDRKDFDCAAGNKAKEGEKNGRKPGWLG